MRRRPTRRRPMADARICDSCGYALDGLEDGPVDRPCPECGVPINTGLARLDRVWLSAVILAAVGAGQWLLSNTLITMLGTTGVSMPMWMRVVPLLSFGLSATTLGFLLRRRGAFRRVPSGGRWIILGWCIVVALSQYAFLAVLVIVE